MTHANMTSWLANVHRSALGEVRYQIEKLLMAGQTVEEAKTAVLAALAGRMPEAQDTYGARVRAAIGTVVAERLARANA